MPHIQVYIHFVWSTKNRVPSLNSPKLRKKVWQHIFENAKSKGIFVDFVNGYSDHCHCLISLGTEQSLKNIMQLIKGESSYWINKNQLTSRKFEWQDDYYASSVSPSKLNVVREYIKNQEEHHHKKSFQEEYEELIQQFDFKKISE
ncbi:MAG: IS200/IS605 family transposase [Salinimicrobium sp.]